MTILVTGGAGFIGSHTCLVLLEAGHQLVVLIILRTAARKPCGGWPIWTAPSQPEAQ